MKRRTRPASCCAKPSRSRPVCKTLPESTPGLFGQTVEFRDTAIHLIHHGTLLFSGRGDLEVHIQDLSPDSGFRSMHRVFVSHTQRLFHLTAATRHRLYSTLHALFERADPSAEYPSTVAYDWRRRADLIRNHRRATPDPPARAASMATLSASD